jgi:hypothetical protein
MKKRSKRTPRFTGVLLGAVIAALSLEIAGQRFLGEAPRQEGTPSGVREQAARFIAYDRSIHLTAEQEETNNRALLGIPAPCCSQFPMATCCCACNLAKAVWGLAKHLIVEKGYGAEQVRGEVESWIAAVNPGGFAGDACFKSRCNGPFHEDGCGGMREDALS